MRHFKILSGWLGITVAALWSSSGVWYSLAVYADSIGACCVEAEATCPCVPNLDEAACAALGGHFLGGGSTCDPQPSGDPCDCNANGECDADDLLPSQTLKDYFSIVGEFIPNVDPFGVTDTIVIDEAGVISDVDVGLEITHSWVGDLCVTVTDPSGVSVTIIDRPGMPDPGPCDEYACCGCSADDYVWVILDDEGTGGAIEDLCTDDLRSPPNRTPNNPLNAFYHSDKQGVWTITVVDSGSSGDVGWFEGWSLHFVNEDAEPYSMDLNENGIPDECECMADFDGDGVVGPFDLAALLGNWGPCPGCPQDLNGDGVVGPFDLASLLGAWGPCS